MTSDEVMAVTTLCVKVWEVPGFFLSGLSHGIGKVR
jgi:hypothetical protein